MSHQRHASLRHPATAPAQRTPAVQAPTTAAAPHAADTLLGLQRIVGNQAVQRMVQRQVPPSIQRITKTRADIEHAGGKVTAKARFQQVASLGIYSSVYTKILSEIDAYHSAAKNHKQQKQQQALQNLDQLIASWLGDYDPNKDSAARKTELELLHNEVQVELGQGAQAVTTGTLSVEQMAKSFGSEDEAYIFKQLWRTGDGALQQQITLLMTPASADLKPLSELSHLLEALDSKHRYGLMSFAQRWVDGNDSDTPFFDCIARLEQTSRGTEMFSSNINSQAQIDYFDDNARQPYQLQLGATISRGSGEALAGDNIYVMAGDQSFYAANETKRQDGYVERRLHHSSFLGGKPVAGAGHMVAKSGKLTAIDNHSGHYQPSEQQLFHTVRTLRAAGVALDEVTVKPLSGTPKNAEQWYQLKLGL